MRGQKLRSRLALETRRHNSKAGGAGDAKCDP
jgi:hypothetical protein